MSEETVGLLVGDTRPRYSFQSSIIQRRRRQVRQFQCCLCIIFLFVMVIVLVSVISYSLNHEENASNDTTQVLLTLNWPIEDKKQKALCSDDLYELQAAFAVGQEALKRRDKLEVNFPVLDPASASFLHQKSFVFSNKSRNLSRMAYVKEVAQRYIQGLKNSSRVCNNFNIFLMDDVAEGTNFCNKTSKYRTYDGSCNNLEHPLTFGVALTPFRRVIPPDYADGISSPRIARNSKPLPSARSVSLTVHRPIYRNDNKFTVMLAVWGQFIDHDITATAISSVEGGRSISCCPENLHPECFSVVVSEDDPFYANYNVTCLDFIRSAPAQINFLGPREQLNQASAFLDGSVIYGNNKNVSDQLRTFEGGKLKMYVTPDNRTLLPLSRDLEDGCNEKEQNMVGKYCFMTGDQRANENLHLTSLHLIWARHHNYLAAELSNVNSHWDDERVFQEVRKILGAQMQHITYSEFLPMLFEPKLRKNSGIELSKFGYYKNYDKNLNSAIANSFAAAAFRFGHTLIPELVKFLKSDDSNFEYVQMRKMLFNPYRLYKEDGLDKSLKSAMDEKSGTSFNQEVKNHLFERKNAVHPCGLDLVSLNIQRGRDHGLPGYVHFREHCGMGKTNSFGQLRGHIDEDSLNRIRSIYENVDDVDIYTGGVSETPLAGGILGPTFTCLILDQFVRIKSGDRLWYENKDVFTNDQLQEIRSTTLAGIICKNADGLEEVQPFVMQQVEKGNNYTRCELLKQPDFEKWKEERRGLVSIESGVLVIAN